MKGSMVVKIYERQTRYVNPLKPMGHLSGSVTGAMKLE